MENLRARVLLISSHGNMVSTGHMAADGVFDYVAEAAALNRFLFSKSLSTPFHSVLFYSHCCDKI